MHMSDALLSPGVAGTMYACQAAALAYSVVKTKKDEEKKNIPVIGVMGAFVFSAQMINFTIPGTGSSGHLCGGMLLSAMLGPEIGFITMIGVLLIQCLMFADGGIMALGANIWNMAFYGCFVGGMIIWKSIMKKGASKKKIMTASILGSVISLQLGAFSVTLETLASNITELPFGVFVSAMQPIHLAIGLVEGIVTGLVLIFVYEARKEMLWGISDDEASDNKKKHRLSILTTTIILAATAIVTGGLFSHFASSNPDGLEWSIEKITGDTELEASGEIYDSISNVQDKTSLLPDYGFAGSESAIGTTVSGIIGAFMVFALAVLVGYIVRIFIKNKKITGV